jgi:ubiquinone/menaquinone biosynthesis C-methylase UbiE
MEKQEIERNKYIKSYTDPAYKMGSSRKASAIKVINTNIPSVNTHLDVSAGRGEIVDYMRDQGVESMGVEIVDSLLVPNKIVFGWANNLPFEDNSFDLITNLDAMEHYLPEQTEQIVEEFCRVAKNYIYFAISNKPSYHLGNNLHINIKTYPAWEEFLSQYGTVSRPFPQDNSISENFLLKL